MAGVNFQEVFNKYDQNGDGFISASELKTVLSELGLPPCDQFAQEIMKGCDQNSDGKLDINEFNIVIQVVQQMQQTMADPEKMKGTLEKIFQDLDENGDGSLSKEELKKGMQKVPGMALSDEQIDYVMKVCDKNEDGKIDYNEFTSYFTSMM